MDFVHKRTQNGRSAIEYSRLLLSTELANYAVWWLYVTNSSAIAKNIIYEDYYILRMLLCLCHHSGGIVFSGCLPVNPESLQTCYWETVTRDLYSYNVRRLPQTVIHSFIYLSVKHRVKCT